MAYTRAPWFRIIREPLSFVMHRWAAIYKKSITSYEVNTASCYNCTRFYKNVLKQHSKLFNLMHSAVNPIFDVILEKIVSAEEIQKAKAHAKAATAGEALPYEGESYTSDELWDRI